jgi:hypothetical protein
MFLLIWRLDDIYLDFKDTGKELVVNGKINSMTQQRVGQNIMPIPSILKLMKNFKFVKRLLLSSANYFPVIIFII